MDSKDFQVIDAAFEPHSERQVDAELVRDGLFAVAFDAKGPVFFEASGPKEPVRCAADSKPVASTTSAGSFWFSLAYSPKVSTTERMSAVASSAEALLVPFIDLEIASVEMRSNTASKMACCFLDSFHSLPDGPRIRRVVRCPQFDRRVDLLLAARVRGERRGRGLRHGELSHPRS